jgi:hypothetical protein
MRFIYEQSTGHFSVFGDAGLELIGTGFAGREAGRNNPAAQDEYAIGPIPRGNYTLGIVVHPRFSAPAYKAVPEALTQSFGRSGFWVHGGTDSHGCIVLGRSARNRIRQLLGSEVGYLTVIR